MADNSGPFRLFWPEIDDVSSAKAASRLGVFGSVGFAILTAGTVTYGLQQEDWPSGAEAWYGYVDAVVFAVLAIGIWLMWRTAAVAALALFLLEQALATIEAGQLVGFLVPILITLFLISGVRGTLGYHKYMNEESPVSDADA